MGQARSARFRDDGVFLFDLKVEAMGQGAVGSQSIHERLVPGPGVPPGGSLLGSTEPNKDYSKTISEHLCALHFES